MRRWKLGAIVAGAVMALMALATSTASAEDIVVLTPASPRASNTLAGNPGGAFHEYWIDMQAGQLGDVRVTPAPETWWTLTANRAGRSRNGGFLAEVWSQDGREDRADFRKQNISIPRCVNRLAGRLGGPGSPDACWSFRASGADILNPNERRFLIKVVNYSAISVPYTVEARGLNAGDAVAGAAPGGQGPMIPDESPSTRSRLPRLTGTLVGTAGGASAYYTFWHPGGGFEVLGGTDADILMTASPALSAGQIGNVGVNLFRGNTLLRTIRGGMEDGGSDLSEARDAGGNPISSNVQSYELEYRTFTPELLTVEIFNYQAGYEMHYAITMST